MKRIIGLIFLLIILGFGGYFIYVNLFKEHIQYRIGRGFKDLIVKKMDTINARLNGIRHVEKQCKMNNWCIVPTKFLLCFQYILKRSCEYEFSQNQKLYFFAYRILNAYHCSSNSICI